MIARNYFKHYTVIQVNVSKMMISLHWLSYWQCIPGSIMDLHKFLTLHNNKIKMNKTSIFLKA